MTRPQATSGTDGELFEKDGVPWYEAPLPRRWHRCKPHTYGRIDGVWIRRCACGGMSDDGRGWAFRNERRREAKDG